MDARTNDNGGAGGGGRAAGSGNSDTEGGWDQWTTETARYEYLDKDGDHAFFKVRGWNSLYKEKRFVTRHQYVEETFRGKELKIGSGYGGAEPILYRLPQLLKAQLGDTVVIVEGEKDADNLAKLGVITTCNPDGARKWKPEYSAQIAQTGAKALIIPDNDEVGREHASLVASSLLAEGVEFSILTLPGLPLHGDVSDWLQRQQQPNDVALHSLFEEVMRRIAKPIRNIDDLDKWQESNGVFVIGRKGPHKGQVIPSIANIRLAVKKLDYVLGFNEFSRRQVIQGWGGDSSWQELTDDMLLTIRLATEEQFRLAANEKRFNDVCRGTGLINSFHPPRDYFARVQPTWDGKVRNFLIDYGGVEDTPFNRKVGELMLIAVVRRVREPGAKFDEMPVLESPEGWYKSTALEILAVERDWFTDKSILNMETKQRIEVIDGKLIVEIADLAGLSKMKDLSKLKADLSRKVDRARLSYGRLAEAHPRQGIFVGTTNNDAYLRDPTGNRRIWPIKTGHFDVEALKRDRDQLWAQAATQEAAWVGDVRLPKELWPAAKEAQEARKLSDGWYDILAEKLANFAYGKVSQNDAFLLVGMGEEKRTRHDSGRLNEVMTELGWKKANLHFGSRATMAGYNRGKGKQIENRIVAVQDTYNTSRTYVDADGKQVVEVVKEKIRVWRAEYVEAF